MPQATEAVLRTANAAAEITEGAPVSAHRTTAKTIANRVTPPKVRKRLRQNARRQMRVRRKQRSRKARTGRKNAPKRSRAPLKTINVTVAESVALSSRTSRRSAGAHPQFPPMQQNARAELPVTCSRRRIRSIALPISRFRDPEGSVLPPQA
ncbi:unknown [Anaerotruncus sp. CAG:390]|nr:unknown [Anaerotruncus sp. CAG:390]